MKKRSVGEILFDNLNVVFLVLCCLTMLYPLWNVLIDSFVTPGEFFSRNIILWPNQFTLNSYRYIFSDETILNACIVTAFVTVAGCFYSLILTTLMAYSLSKKYLPGRNIFLIMITFTMFFSGGLIPSYILTKNLGLMNTLAVLILPVGINTWNFIVIKSFFSQLPVELEEAAKLDGASEFQIFFRIILPISGPVLATFALFYGVQYWNVWFSVELYIQNSKLYTLQFLLRQMIYKSSSTGEIGQIGSMKTAAMQAGMKQDSDVFTEGVQMATVVVATVPILFVYPFLQKYFVKGVIIGSIKG